MCCGTHFWYRQLLASIMKLLGFHVVILLYFVADASSYDAKPNHFTNVGFNTFDPSAEAESLKNALYSSNVHKVVNILTHKTYNQRLEIADKFKLNYGKYLKEELEANVDDEVKVLLIALVRPSNTYYAEALYHAMSGAGTDEDVLIDIICTLPTSQLQAVSNTYEAVYKRNLIDDVKDETSGEFEDFLVSLLEFKRDNSAYTSKDEAYMDAKALYAAGAGQAGTDERVFYDVLSSRNYYQLRKIFDEYAHFAEHDIEYAIRDEFSGDTERALLAFVSSVRNMPAYFAARLHECLSDGNLERVSGIVVTRSEIDMSLIKKEYYALFQKQLEEDINAHTKGLFKDALHNLINFYH